MHTLLLMYIWVGVLGLILGSFANVLIARIPKGESIGGRSHCMTCGRTLQARDLVPVISFLLLKAKCRTCGENISWRYPLIELLTAALFILAAWMAQGNIMMTIALAISFYAMLLIVATDFDTQTIPDAFTLLLFIGAVSLRITEGSWSVAAPLIGLGFFGLQWLLSRGRWVGSGDIFLAGALGILLGSWLLMLLSLWFAYIIGAAVAVIILIRHKRKAAKTIAFGPFLILGAFISLLFGDFILFSVL